MIIIPLMRLLLPSNVPLNGKESFPIIAFSNEEIWDMIEGEISFYNEWLKNASVSFWLTKGKENEISKVYQMMRNFICAGKVGQDGRIQVTVLYEGFYYRKVHMALMALQEYIEDISPEDVAHIIQKRVENIKKNDRS